MHGEHKSLLPCLWSAELSPKSDTDFPWLSPALHVSVSANVPPLLSFRHFRAVLRLGAILYSRQRSADHIRVPREQYGFGASRGRRPERRLDRDCQYQLIAR